MMKAYQLHERFLLDLEIYANGPWDNYDSNFDFLGWNK